MDPNDPGAQALDAQFSGDYARSNRFLYQVLFGGTKSLMPKAQVFLELGHNARDRGYDRTAYMFYRYALLATPKSNRVMRAFVLRDIGRFYIHRLINIKAFRLLRDARQAFWDTGNMSEYTLTVATIASAEQVRCHDESALRLVRECMPLIDIFNIERDQPCIAIETYMELFGVLVRNYHNLSQAQLEELNKINDRLSFLIANHGSAREHLLFELLSFEYNAYRHRLY
jgi:hypothetical protein